MKRPLGPDVLDRAKLLEITVYGGAVITMVYDTRAFYKI